MQRERVASVRLPRRAGGVQSKKKKLRGRAVSMQVATKTRSIAGRVAVEVDAFFNIFSQLFVQLFRRMRVPQAVNLLKKLLNKARARLKLL